MVETIGVFDSLWFSVKVLELNLIGDGKGCIDGGFVETVGAVCHADGVVLVNNGDGGDVWLEGADDYLVLILGVGT